MEKILLEFIDTLHATLKRLQTDHGTGLARLTVNQFNYIDAIQSLGEPTITEIAEWLNFSKASVTAGINKLVALGYVQKSQSSVDRRSVHANLTPASRELLATRDRALHAYGEYIRAVLSEEEARQLESILAKLVQGFQANASKTQKDQP